MTPQEKQCCNKEYLKENCPCVKAERQRIKEKIKDLTPTIDFDFFDSDIESYSKGYFKMKEEVLALLEEEK